MEGVVRPLAEVRDDALVEELRVGSGEVTEHLSVRRELEDHVEVLHAPLYESAVQLGRGEFLVRLQLVHLHILVHLLRYPVLLLHGEDVVDLSVSEEGVDVLEKSLVGNIFIVEKENTAGS